ncbi:DUF4270 family protein [Pontibacter populi]|uniref:DUF4270 family protein n=1 Tax=Pontibacter populi TaxID=890055 RepID=A0ABV1RSR1_9BACT
MNLAVRRFTLFFFSIATLASCEDPSDIGLDLQDENQIGAFYTDTLTINTGTVLKSDSILAFRQYPLPVGGYQDGTLGNVKATAFTEVGLSGLDLKFGENPVADSLVLTLDYTTDIYGSDDPPLNLSIHRLTEGFQDKASYFTNSSLAYESTPLGTVSFDPDPIDTSTATVKTPVFTEPVRIHLDMALANEILAQSGKTTLKDQFNFVQFFKGLAIVPTQANPREVISLNTLSSKTRLTLYYKNDTTRKEHSFLLNGSNIRNFSKIETNRSATALAGLTPYKVLPSSQTGGESYVQAGTQLFTKITIPHLKELKEKYGNIVINRAELVVPVKNNSFTTLREPLQLGIYETNSSNRVLYTSSGVAKTVPIDDARIMSANNYSFPTYLQFDAETRKEGSNEVRTGVGSYKVNVTAYVQAILRGDKPNDGLLITPGRYLASSNGGGTIGLESIPKRAIIVNTEEQGVKLRIYFTKLD